MTNTTLSPLLSSPGALPGFLIVESGSLAGQRFPLPQAPGSLLLGRERLCNVRFDPERDRVVGRTHARIEVRPDGIFLVDLNSANGTFRGDGSAVRGEVRLSPGDRFQLGGEGGPCLSLQTDAAQVAVHMVPPASEMPTLVIPSVAGARPWLTPAAPAAPAALRPPPIGAPQSFPTPEPMAQRSVAGTYSLPDREPEPRRRPEPVPADPVALQQRTRYQRQIVAIALLLILACAVGLAFGLRGPGEDDVETVLLQ